MRRIMTLFMLLIAVAILSFGTNKNVQTDTFEQKFSDFAGALNTYITSYNSDPTSSTTLALRNNVANKASYLSTYNVKDEIDARRPWWNPNYTCLALCSSSWLDCMNNGGWLNSGIGAGCNTDLSFCNDNCWRSAAGIIGTLKPSYCVSKENASTGITCKSWRSDENTWADLWALAAWDSQMQVDSPQEMRTETVDEIGCGVGSAPGCVSGTKITICYGSFP